jgi:hypothetical protein
LILNSQPKNVSSIIGGNGSRDLPCKQHDPNDCLTTLRTGVA